MAANDTLQPGAEFSLAPQFYCYGWSQEKPKDAVDPQQFIKLIEERRTRCGYSDEQTMIFVKASVRAEAHNFVYRGLAADGIAKSKELAATWDTFKDAWQQHYCLGGETKRTNWLRTLTNPASEPAPIYYARAGDEVASFLETHMDDAVKSIFRQPEGIRTAIEKACKPIPADADQKRVLGEREEALKAEVDKAIAAQKKLLASTLFDWQFSLFAKHIFIDFLSRDNTRAEAIRLRDKEKMPIRTLWDKVIQYDMAFNQRNSLARDGAKPVAAVSSGDTAGDTVAATSSGNGAVPRKCSYCDKPGHGPGRCFKKRFDERQEKKKKKEAAKRAAEIAAGSDAQPTAASVQEPTGNGAGW